VARELDRPQARHPGGHDDELVAAVPAHDVVRAHVLPARLRQLHEDLVAGDVAVHVVDPLEAVHVDHQRGEGLA